MRKKSPLKQLGSNQNNQQALLKQNQQKGMFKSGMDILAENQRRKSWEELQLDIKMIEPESMQIRKHRDKLLREDQKADRLGTRPVYLNVYALQVKKYQEEIHAAIKNNDKKGEKDVMLKVAGLKQMLTILNELMQEFDDDHFKEGSFLSKGVSQQQVSFATQMFCRNDELIITFAAKEDVLRGQLDYYGNLVREEEQYAIVKDFYNNPVLVNIINGNKDMFLTDRIKAMEYMGFVNKLNAEATEARKGKSVVDIDLGRINYKMDTLFGINDGTATEKQDQLVLIFAHDDAVLEDSNTFKRHLYEHPNLQNLNYGGFDFETMQFNPLLGPGDINYWHDEIDELDRLRLVDAICNQDNEFFDIKLLRTLVKEYYTIKAEDAWWKGMGFDKGRLDLMRLKQKELIKERFKMEKAKAAQDGKKDFVFDGKVYPTGANLKKQKEEQDQIIKSANTGLNQ